MVARLQRWLVVGWLVIAIAWTSFWWGRSMGIAIAGLLVLACVHAGVLAFEFFASYRVNAPDPIPRGSAAQYIGAWLAECVAAPTVFGWRQPFRSQSIPDRLQPDARRGAVLVHGFVGNRGFWNPWLRELQASGRAFVAVTLEPAFGSIDHYVEIVEDAMARVTAATGQPPLLICHSMGGLAARAWLRDSDGSRAHRIVTIATPHRGTWLARFGRTVNGREMRVGGEWLQKIEGERASTRQVPFTCWYSNCDNIVFPTSVATLPGADNRIVSGRAHVELAFDPRVMRETLALLEP
ncbi:triacylglycerol lipase [Variovorax sp. J22R115]|uniref:esterase/lipase family protein n=1 Tax=Variovorax sp. J22R115 TaxID=3053509 RepID=UPI002574F8CF|nr:alpha/beta fold hydrolase [Variovorax sp. J22R115]MDM0048875.1 alpha/beta fold hydrolase [Variovorax sp. J22R115]